jgi:hypothetical protein
MTGTTIICPQCKATLKLPVAIPAGLKPKCPRCGTLVAAAMNSPLPPLPSSNGTAVQSPPQTRTIDPLVTLGIVISCGFLVVLLTAILIVVCLHGEDKNSAVANADAKVDEPEFPADVAPVIVPKAAPRKTTPAAIPLVVLTAAEQKKIELAIQRGVEFLKSRQIRVGPDSGSWKDRAQHADVGYTALAGLTLLESNVTASDPAVQGAAKYIRSHVKQGFGGNETYQVSVSVLFLSRLAEKADAPLIRSLALRLVASQYASGGWYYHSPPLSLEQESQLLYYLQGHVNAAGTPNAVPYVGLGTNDGGQDFADNSNTQFALLALWAARRYDLPIDPVLRLVAKRFRNTQRADGSWSYQQDRVVTEYPTMTAAGLLGLAVGYGLDSERRGGGDMASDEILQKGFDRLAAGIGTSGGFSGQPRRVEPYFLWCVERVAVLYHQANIRGKDWYRWGVEILLHYQDPATGKWEMGVGHGPSDIVDTCFALLFLQRANLAKDLTDKIQQLAQVLGQVRQKD